MRRKRLLWQLYPSYLLITLVSLFAVAGLAAYSLERIFLATMHDHLRQQAELVDDLVDFDFTAADEKRLPAMCERLHALSDIRVTLVSTAGIVICDSAKREQLENHSDRPEIIAALAGRVGESTRFSNTVKQQSLYVAIPAPRDGQVVGIVRTSMPITSIASALRDFRVAVVSGGVVIALLAAGVSLWVARWISRPLEEMRAGAERFARGDLEHPMVVPDSAEMARLAETLNDMARQLEERLRAMVRQNNEQQAVLGSMVEGVLAVDSEHRIISMNRAAVELLGTPTDETTGRSLHEVIRNVELRRLVNHALLSDVPLEGDIVMRGDPERVLQVQGAALRDAQERAIGAVIVLNDVTRFRQLENMRRDFVANVSHELKTPITSIKGFLETLLDGAIDDREDAERFLRIMVKHAERLNGIIEDLLALASIEQSEESGEIALEPTPLRAVLEAALYDCQARAQEREVKVDLSCSDAVTARANPPLLEQAVVNLLDNAIKYSEQGGKVEVTAASQNGEVVISVRDHGCGIPQEHLPRIFERFYRVDKARSRKLGGTGLGLSIVKHIIQAHHGRVLVETKPGQGSVFSIRLPA